MNRALAFLTAIYLVLFAATGALMVLVLNVDESSQPWLVLLSHNQNILFGWHLVCWMILGMFTSYYWDLFNLGKGIEAVQIPRLLLPLMVSPFVFLPIYNLWQSSSSQSYMLFIVIAIQSGFFWQALFTKLAPLDRPAAIPWTVQNGGRSKAAAPQNAEPTRQAP